MSGMSRGQAVTDNVVRRFVRFPTTEKVALSLEEHEFYSLLKLTP